MVAELIHPVRDRILLGPLPVEDRRSYLLGPQRRPGPPDALLLDQRSERMLPVALLDRGTVRISGEPLTPLMGLLEGVFMGQGEYHEGAVRREFDHEMTPKKALTTTDSI